MKKQKKHRKIPALAASTTLVAAMTLMASCSTNYEDKIVYNDIQQPFQQDFKKDTVVFDKLPAEFAKHILNLSDPSTEIVGKADYTFQTNNLISVKKSAVGDSLVITSWSAKTVSNVTLEMYIPEADEYIPVAFFRNHSCFLPFLLQAILHWQKKRMEEGRRKFRELPLSISRYEPDEGTTHQRRRALQDAPED